MVHVLLLPKFDAVFVAQIAQKARSFQRDVRLIGMTNRPIPSTSGLRMMPDVRLSELQDKVNTLVIPDCEAKTQLMTEVRIHRLIDQDTFVTPTVAATLAQVGITGMKVVRSAEEVERMGERSQQMDSYVEPTSHRATGHTSHSTRRQ